MDGERFDSLIKRLGTMRLTRLAALRGLVAAVSRLRGRSCGGGGEEASGWTVSAPRWCPPRGWSGGSAAVGRDPGVRPAAGDPSVGGVAGPTGGGLSGADGR